MGCGCDATGSARCHRKRSILPTFDAEGSAALPGPSWLRARRAEAFAAFSAVPLPSETEEVWRYTPIDHLDLGALRPAAARRHSDEARSMVSSLVAALGPRAAHALAVNGTLDTVAGGEDFAFGGVSDVVGSESMVGDVQVGGDALVLLNDAFVPDVVLVDVPAGVHVDDPIVIVHWAELDAGTSAFPRTRIRLGANAHASVVELYAGARAPGRSLVAPVTELSAGAGATLDYVSLQVLGDAAWSIARLTGTGEADSHIRTFTVGLGGAYARIRTDIATGGRGAGSEILSAYLGRGTQVHDIRTLQDHVAPRTTSELLCQGAVAGTSHSVYSGLIRVHRGAVRTDARQTNHNLVLSEGAHADSVPNLDILENDVRCSHASTVGPIDEDQRYYIESRGISPDVAEGLIVAGFFDAVLERNPVKAATPLLRREIRARLDQVLEAKKEPVRV